MLEFDLPLVNKKDIKVTFDGKNNPHIIEFNDKQWQCDCDFFQSRGRCSHTMALEIILEGMIHSTE